MFARFIEPVLRVALNDRPVTFLQGPRQSGKTSLVRQLNGAWETAEYRTFDDLATLSAARNDPAGFMAGFRGKNLILDEVQRVPEVCLPIKYEVDLDRRPGRFLLTGSASAMVVPQLADALVGRMELIALWPLAQAEIEARTITEALSANFVDLAFGKRLMDSRVVPLQRDALIQRLLRGGFPEVVSQIAPGRYHDWFASYISTLVQRDVRDLSNIQALGEMPNLLTLLGARATGPLNITDLARSVKLPRATLDRYLSLLNALFMMQLVQPWSINISSRVVKAPKILISDAGLLAYLLNIASSDQLTALPTQLGVLLENFVGMELLKLSGWSQAKPKLWYYRTHDGKEVDYVLENRQGQLFGIEVKAAATVSSSDFNGLRAFSQSLGTHADRVVGGLVIYTGDSIVPFGEHLFAVPVSALWG